MSVRLCVAIALLAAVARAEPRQRKTAPDKFVKAASEKFVEALEADNANKLDDAQGMYEQAFEISPHPSTAYNLADVYRRKNALTKAIAMYETYLVLSPTASDAKEVTALVAKLTATSAVMTVKSSARKERSAMDLGKSYILIAGEVVKKAGEPVAIDGDDRPTIDVLSLARRDVLVEVVSPLSYGKQQMTNVEPGGKYETAVHAPPRIDGNVVIAGRLGSSPVRILATDFEANGREHVLADRVKLPPGKHTLSVWDLQKECALLTIDVPSNDDVLYIYIDAEQTQYRTRCRKYTVKQRVLKF